MGGTEKRVRTPERHSHRRPEPAGEVTLQCRYGWWGEPGKPQSPRKTHDVWRESSGFGGQRVLVAMKTTVLISEMTGWILQNTSFLSLQHSRAFPHLSKGEVALLGHVGSWWDGSDPGCRAAVQLQLKQERKKRRQSRSFLEEL